MNIDYINTQYDPSSIKTGIVHIGLGAFVRAHLAVYTEKLLNQTPGPWGICAANIRSNDALVEVLKTQKMRYTVAEYESEERLALREVNSIREALFAGDGDTAELLRCIDRDDIRIVSLTVTEKGYYFDLAERQLLKDDPDVRHDMTYLAEPRTAIGVVLAGLYARFKSGRPPFTVLSCDNMPHNGAAAREAVLQLAACHDAALTRWIADHVAFPSTMVDRIVPAATPESIARVQPLIKGYQDEIPVPTEAFSQWVIEDNFPQGRPAWETVGAALVDRVAPWEDMKLRMLNGSHSLLAYLGFLGGLQHVSDCMEQGAYVELIRHYMLKEAAPTLAIPEGADPAQYAQRLLKRFANSNLRHRTYQIAMDGSQKIPQRWLAGAKVLLEVGEVPRATTLGVAAWLRYLTGVDEQGEPFEVSDPQAQQLGELARAHASPSETVAAFMALPLFRQYNLADYTAFTAQATADLERIQERGARAAVASLVDELAQS